MRQTNGFTFHVWLGTSFHKSHRVLCKVLHRFDVDFDLVHGGSRNQNNSNTMFLDARLLEKTTPCVPEKWRVAAAVELFWSVFAPSCAAASTCLSLWLHISFPQTMHTRYSTSTRANILHTIIIVHVRGTLL